MKEIQKKWYDFTIVERYFLKSYAITTVAILLAIFGLYVVIDMMANIRGVIHDFDSVKQTIVYYVATFSKRLDVLLPFSCLIATIRCLFHFQSRGELVAMLASGSAKRDLMRPFVLFTTAAALFLYMNSQFIMPSSVRYIEKCQSASKKSAKSLEMPREVMLDDGSKIIYTRYLPKEEIVEDLFWVRSPDEIYHAKRLLLAEAQLTEGFPTGKWVDAMKRNSTGALEKVASYESFTFHGMHFNKSSLKSSLIPPKEQSLLQLMKQSLLLATSTSTKASETISVLIYRLTTPWMCLLALIACAPFCLTIQRTVPLFMTYLIAISALFCFHVVIEAAFILGKSQVVSPIIAIGLPWIAVSYYFTKKFLELDA